MRLGYLVPQFPSQTHAFFWREVQALERQGVEVVLISTRRPDQPCHHRFAEEARNRTHYLWPPRGWKFAPMVGQTPRAGPALKYLGTLTESSMGQRLRSSPLVLLAARLKALCDQQQLDHLHVHSCADSAHLAAMAHRMGGPAYSLCLHGDLPVYGRDHQAKMRDSAFLVPVTRALQRQVIEEIGLPIDRVPVIPMGVDTRRFDAQESNDQPGPTDKPRIDLATVARLHQCKGHRYALAAVRQAVDQGVEVHYHIAGDGPDRQSVEQERDRLELGDYVELLGSIPEHQVRLLLGRCDALVLSSVGLGEAAPVAVMEAMACGKPAICSIIGGTADMITDGDDGFLVDQEDSQTLAKRIGQLARDPALRKRMGHAARQRAVREFDCTANAQRLLETIQRAHHHQP